MVQVDGLSSELRRILSLAPAEQDDRARELLIWDSLGLDRSLLESVGHGLGLPLRVCEPGSDLEVTDSSSTPTSSKFAQAAALACCAGRSPAVDFLHSRLAPRRKPRLGRRTLWGAAASAVLLAAGLFLLLDWHTSRQKVTALQKQLAGLRDGTEEAKDLVENTTFARAWYDRRPRFLDCVREITQAFPQEGRIWATSLMVREDMQVLLTGKAVNEGAVLEVLDRLNANPRLSNVKQLFIRQVGGTSREWSFAISLSLRGGS